MRLIWRVEGAGEEVEEEAALAHPLGTQQLVSPRGCNKQRNYQQAYRKSEEFQYTGGRFWRFSVPILAPACPCSPCCT